MSEDQKRDLIRVTQLPVIEEQLKSLSAEIDTKVNEAMSMVCTEDTVKAVKKVRAELNSQFWELEGQRKAVKKAIMGPYERFEQIYSKYISQKFKAADDNLKAKINETEDNLRQAKESELQAWTAEYIASVNVDFLRPEDAGIKVNLSSSMASLKKAAKEFVDRVAGDCAMIDSLEDAAEVMTEYRQNGFRASDAILTVKNRHESIKRQKEEAERRARERAAAAAAAAKASEAISAPTVAPAVEVPTVGADPAEAPQKKSMDDILTVRFTVRDTRGRLIVLRDWLNSNGYEYQ